MQTQLNPPTHQQLRLNPDERAHARTALAHPFFAAMPAEWRALDGTDLATFPEGCPAEFNDFEYSQREQTTAELRDLITEEAGRWH